MKKYWIELGDLYINSELIEKLLKKYKYKKYCVTNDKLKIHKNENNANIIFK